MPVRPCQRLDVVLVLEPRQVDIGLRLQVGAGDAALGLGVEQRQAGGVDQVVHQAGDEHGLAGARQAGDAEADTGTDNAAGRIGHRAEHHPRFIKNAGKFHAAPVVVSVLI